MKQILIVEDDEILSQELKELLENAGYEANILKDFKNAYDIIINNIPNLILLDINIPYLNGEMLLKRIREKSDVPVMMVTSRVSESDEVIAISNGADDYITKPYNPMILLLRINAILKRVNKNIEKIKYQDLEIDLKKGIIIRNKMMIELTKNEMIILRYLLNNRNRIVSRDELMTDLWNSEEYVNDNALTVNISRLRSKLKELGVPDIIETRRGIGYILL